MLENKYYLGIIENNEFKNVGQEFIERPVIRIIPPKTNISISYEHLSPAIVDEYFPIKIKIDSNSDNIINGVLNFEPIEGFLFFNHNLDLIHNISFGEILKGVFFFFLIFY
jgi:hypothetical protein